MSKFVIAVVADLIFSSKIEATLGRDGFLVRTVEDLEGLRQELAANPAAQIVILDLHAGVGADDVTALTRPLGLPVLAFGRHTDAALLRAAREAGCSAAVPRSTFVEEMAALAESMTGPHP
jgi:hypothetical protein